MPEWMQQGACRGKDPDIFFPEKEEGSDTGPAKAICAECPVIGECLEYSLSLGSRLEGVWAGLSARGRRRYRYAQNRKAAA